MEIKNENIMAAYNAADKSGKQMLRAMFPEMEWNVTETDNRPITERVKTFEDACAVLGNHALVNQYRRITEEQNPPMDETAKDLVAYLKLRIIAAALNEGWEPQFTEDEDRWYPWFFLYTDEELAEKSEGWKRDRCLQSTGECRTSYAGFAYAASTSAPSGATSAVGSRLCFKSDTLATYAGKQFINLWMDFYLIRK